MDLAEQQGLFTLIERSASGDRAQVVGSIAEARSGDDLHSLVTHFADPNVTLVTITVTESGYHALPDGRPSQSDDVDADLDRLTNGQATEAFPRVTTLPGRLLLGLNARRRANGHPIAIVPCDNVPANGAGLRRSLLARAAKVDQTLAEWIATNVSFVSTVVDRITPASTPDDVVEARGLTGFDDHTPVVTEPFHDWILEDRFPLDRPAWESVGAKFVANSEPFEQRKLRMLNGAHTLLACTGLVRGHSTVAEAIDDPTIRRLVDRFWDEAARTLAPETEPARYRIDLLSRFANPRIRHTLTQIGDDSLRKVRLRILPVLQAELAAGRSGDAAKTAIAAWLRFQEQEGTLVNRRERLAALDERLAADDQTSDVILDLVDD